MTDITVFQAFVLGALQGVAEFLPISSSAHLSLAPWAFHWPEPGLAFDVALHVGTLAALLWYFRVEWVRLARAGVHILATRRVQTDDERRALFIVIATVPGGLAGKLLQHQAETVFRAPALTAVALIVMGALLWVVDRQASRTRAAGDMRWTDALLIGGAQAFAIIPGVSRSGATITAGRALRFNRSDAAVFSFVMSIPIIFGAAVLELPKAIRVSGITAPLVVGVLTAAVSSLFAITVVLRFVQTRSFAVFAWYRFALGAAVLALVAARGG